MYRVEHKSFRELFDIWMDAEDDPEPAPADSTTATMTDAVQSYTIMDGGPMPLPLMDTVVTHYLNERASGRDVLVSCSLRDRFVQFVWRIAE